VVGGRERAESNRNSGSGFSKWNRKQMGRDKEPNAEGSIQLGHCPRRTRRWTEGAPQLPGLPPQKVCLLVIWQGQYIISAHNFYTEVELWARTATSLSNLHATTSSPSSAETIHKVNRLILGWTPAQEDEATVSWESLKSTHKRLNSGLGEIKAQAEEEIKYVPHIRLILFSGWKISILTKSTGQ
jgi:hypothetical protein